MSLVVGPDGNPLVNGTPRIMIPHQKQYDFRVVIAPGQGFGLMITVDGVPTDTVTLTPESANHLGVQLIGAAAVWMAMNAKPQGPAPMNDATNAT
jgi:hypothetical protein